ncbi:MAG: FecR domain-containing protein [Deltaproteobacteria bacterium]|nr:FecR domain-containing protein [Deltaproteobacteria bacterium]
MTDGMQGRPPGTRRIATSAALILILAFFLPAVSFAGTQEGWISDYIARLVRTRDEAGRKVRDTERTVSKTDRLLSLAREANNTQAEALAGEARTIALAAREKYRRALDRSEAGIRMARSYLEKSDADAGYARNTGVFFRMGTVDVRRGGTQVWNPPGEGAVVLAPGDSVRTGSDGRVELRVMADGSRIDVAPSTTLKVIKDAIRLDLGKVLLRIAKGINRKLIRFRVKTPVAVCGVRGTEFAVHTEPDGRTVVSVLEGNVEITSLNGGEPVILKAGQELVISSDHRPLVPRKFDLAEIRRGFEM